MIPLALKHVSTICSTVLFYKPRDLILSEQHELKKEDFALIILKKKSLDCVCIDGTHLFWLKCLQLHMLLVLDDLRQRCPTVFLISNLSDQEVMTLFFSCICHKSQSLHVMMM